MADIADAKANINDIEVDADAALSEALFEKIGGAINYLNTTTDDHETRIAALEGASYGTVDVNYNSTPNTTSETTVATLSSVTIPTGGMAVFWFNPRRQSGWPDGTADLQSFHAFSSGELGASVNFRFKRDSTAILTESKPTSASTVFHIRGNTTLIDAPSAGTYDYTLTFQYTVARSQSVVVVSGTINYIVFPFS